MIMKMGSRWIVSVVAIVVVAMLMTQPILANVMPDSPFYPIKRIIENFELMFTFDEVSRAKKLVEYAKMRLVEAEYVYKRGKNPTDLVEDYERDLSSALSLMDSAKPEDASKIAEIIVNATLESSEIVAKSDLPNKDPLERATLLDGEMAIRKLARIDPNSAYRLSLEYANTLLKRGDRISVQESDRVLRIDVDLSKGSLKNTKDIVKLVESIVNEATNLSNARRGNLTEDILKKGLSIYGTLFRR